MNFKNITLLALTAIGLSLSSCNLDNDPENNYIEGVYVTCNHVSPIDGNAFVTNANYKLTFYYTEGKAALSTTDLSLGYGTTTFASSAMNYNTYYASTPQTGTFDITKFSGGSYNQNNLFVDNINGAASSGVNIISTNDPQIPGYDFTPYIPLVLSYNVNYDYTVRTFSKDAVYNGITNVRTASTGDVYTNDEIRYRVIFSEDFKNADIIFYDAKFASMMPRAITFVLKNLNVEITKAGYIISSAEGETIIPYQYESGGLTAMEGYPFTKFVLTNVSDNLTVAYINYTVQLGPNAYNCDFSGQYVFLGGQE